MDSFARKNGPMRWIPLLMFPIVADCYKSRYIWLRLFGCQQMEKKQTQIIKKRNWSSIRNDLATNNATLSEGICILVNMLKGYGEYSWCSGSVEAVLCLFVYATETMSAYAK